MPFFDENQKAAGLSSEGPAAFCVCGLAPGRRWGLRLATSPAERLTRAKEHERIQPVAQWHGERESGGQYPFVMRVSTNAQPIFLACFYRATSNKVLQSEQEEAFMEDLQRARVAVELLRQTSTKDTIQAFLKSKGLPFSGTWEDIRDRRLLPAVEAHTCTVQELVDLLRSAEEHGRQHIFLYKCEMRDAAVAMDRGRICAELVGRNLSGVLEQPAILERPLIPTIVDVRWPGPAVDRALIIKEVETRESQHPLREQRSPDGKTLTKTYELRQERAVNLIRLHRDGFLEIRISARSTGSTRYKQDVGMFWARLRGLLDQAKFRPVLLTELKAKTLSDREGLGDRIRFSNSYLRNEDGTTMMVSSSGIDADLYGDSGAANGIKAFLDEDGYCEGSTFFFTKNSDLSKDVHVLLTGELNEFAITADCSEEDYEYVLNQVRTINARVSGRAEGAAALAETA